MTCVTEFSVDLSNTIVTVQNIPANPCKNMQFVTFSQGIDLTDNRFCFAQYSQASNIMYFNISFDGQGWNYRYLLNNTNNLIQLRLSVPSAFDDINIFLRIPQVSPAFDLFCQTTQSQQYSALISNAGGCLPYVSQLNFDAQGGLLFSGYTCFNVTISRQFIESEMRPPIAKLQATTQQISSSDSNAVLLGEFQNIFDVNAFFPTTNETIQTTISSSNITIPNLQRGKYNFMLQYTDQCKTKYNSTVQTLYVLDFVNYDVKLPIICTNSSNTCSTTVLLNNITRYTTQTLLCQSISFYSGVSKYSLSSFSCALTDDMLTVNFVNVNNNFDFQILENTQLIIDQSAFSRRSEPFFSYLASISLTVSTIQILQDINFSNIYCNIQNNTYAAIALKVSDNVVPTNSFGCKTKVILTNSAFNEQQVFADFSFSYSGCFKQNITGTHRVYRAVLVVEPLTVTVLNSSDLFTIQVTFYENTFDASRTTAQLTSLTANASLVDKTYNSVNGMWSFRYQLQSTEDYSFAISNGVNRCGGSADQNYSVSIGKIIVYPAVYTSPTDSTMCNSTNYVNFTAAQINPTFLYSEPKICTQISSLYNLTSLKCSDLFSNFYTAGNSTCTCDANGIFTLTLIGSYLLSESSENNKLNALCSKLTERICIYIPDPIQTCANIFLANITICNYQNANPNSLFYSIQTSYDQVSNIKSLNTTAITRFQKQLNKNQISNETIAISNVSLVDVFNCTLECDKSMLISLFVESSIDVTNVSPILYNSVTNDKIPITQVNQTYFKIMYTGIDSVGNFSIMIDYINNCGDMKRQITLYNTTIIKNVTMSLSNQSMFINSFVYYNLKPDGFKLGFNQQSCLINGKTYVGVVSSDKTQIAYNNIEQVTGCSFSLKTVSLNNTISSLSTQNCNFSMSGLMQLLNSSFTVSITVLNDVSKLTYKDAVLSVVVVDSFLDITKKCEVVTAIVASSPPPFYYPGRDYMLKCLGVYVMQTSVNNSTAEQFALSSSPIVVKACNSWRACAETVIDPSQFTFQGSESVDISTYGQWVNLPAFHRHNLIATVSMLGDVQSALVKKHMFEAYNQCLNASNCPYIDFPHSPEALALASTDALRQLLKTQMFSAEQLDVVGSPLGLVGRRYLDALVAHQYQQADANRLFAHLLLVQNYTTLSGASQLGLSGVWRFALADSVLVAMAQDMFSCTAYYVVEELGVRLVVEGLDGVWSSCVAKSGFQVVVKVTNLTVRIQQFGASSLRVALNRTVACWDGAVQTRAGNGTVCVGAQRSVEIVVGTQSLSSFAIGLIAAGCVLAVVVVVGAVWLVRSGRCRCRRSLVGLLK